MWYVDVFIVNQIDVWCWCNVSVHMCILYVQCQVYHMYVYVCVSLVLYNSLWMRSQTASLLDCIHDQSCILSMCVL